MSLILDKINYVYSEGTAYQIQALKDVNLEIRDGQFIGVIGHTGSGKSTLIQHLNGLVKATSGTIYFNGQDIYDEDFDLRELRNRVGLVFQYPEHQLFETTIFDDVCFGPKNQGLSKEEAGLRAFEALRSVGLPEELYYQSPFDLSGGQKRRVVLAKILAGHFDVLLLDEPTNHLDQEMITWLEEYLRSYRGTVLMVTHDRYFLDRVTNRILELSHGKMYGYDADYTGFLELKAAREERELATERKRQSVLRMELEWAKRGCRARTTKQKARLERLEELKNGKAPVKDQTVELDSVETRMGKKTVELHHVSKAFGEKKILNDFDYNGNMLKNSM